MLERREARVGLDELQVERPGGCGADHDEDTGPLHLRCWVVVVERDEQPRLNLGGYWSTYWYNGNVLGSEIARGFDSLRLEPIAAISRNEITAAGEIRQESFNAQLQSRLVAAPSFAVGVPGSTRRSGRARCPATHWPRCANTWPRPRSS